VKNEKKKVFKIDEEHKISKNDEEYIKSLKVTMKIMLL
jgi:hypothetical protein